MSHDIIFDIQASIDLFLQPEFKTDSIFYSFNYDVYVFRILINRPFNYLAFPIEFHKNQISTLEQYLKNNRTTILNLLIENAGKMLLINLDHRIKIIEIPTNLKLIYSISSEN